jgi:hypothetical protein
MKPRWEQNKLRHNSLSLANALCYRMVFINHVDSISIRVTRNHGFTRSAGDEREVPILWLAPEL